jgi:O-antigen/teichoic acid export membrane protein
VQISVQLISFFVLARLLTPNDIGLISVAMAFIGIAHMIRDFGLNTYMIQERELTHERICTAFTITLIISLVLFALMQLIAGPLAVFFSDDRMSWATRMLAINFLLIPFNSTTMSCLRRDMRFDILAMINVPASLVGATVAVTLAALGYGYQSLVWSAVASVATGTLGGAIYRRREFFLRPTLCEWHRVFGFGSRATFVNVFADMSSRVIEISLGRMLGFTAVGYLSRAQGVMLLFQRDLMEAINNVAFPAFARTRREGGDLESAYRRTVTAVTALAWPFYGFFALFPHESLRVLFGPQWDTSAPLVPLYCAVGAVGATIGMFYSILNSVGRVDLITRAEIICQVVRLSLILGAAVVFRDLLAVAVATLLAGLVNLPIQYWFKGKALPTVWPELLAALAVSGKLALFSLLAPAAIKLLIVFELWQVPALVVLLTAVLALASTWILGLRYFDHPILIDPVLPQRIRQLIRRRQ